MLSQGNIVSNFYILLLLIVALLTTKYFHATKLHLGQVEYFSSVYQLIKIFVESNSKNVSYYIFKTVMHLGGDEISHLLTLGPFSDLWGQIPHIFQ